MAKQTINPPPNNSMEFNTGDAAERGDSPKQAIDKVNAMMTELYTLVSGISAAELGYLDGITPGTNAASKAVVAGTDGKVGALTFDGAITQEVVGVTTAGVGAKNGATVTAVENGDPVLHRTVLTLASTPITLTDDAGQGQYGGVKLYDFPAGNIIVLGAVVDADLTLNETWWVDTIPGNVGLGSAAPSVGTALDGARQNIIATTAVAALVAQAGPIDAQSVAAVTLAAAGAADSDTYLNVRIDDNAAHMPDVVTNGAFAADTDWTKGTGWTIAAGVADCDGTQVAVSNLSQTPTLVDGVSYILTFTLTRSAGSVTPSVGGTAGTARSTADTFVETIVAGATDTLVFAASDDFVGTIDNVTLTPLTGSGVITGAVTLTWINLGDIA